MRVYLKLGLICLGALLLRLVLLNFVDHPGIADPNHYYNLGRQLVAGHGFQTDYLWQYFNPPDQINHPDDMWMPLTGILAAAGMVLFGTGVHAALVPFVVLGALLPVVSFAGARQLGFSDSTALLSAAFMAILPEFVLNSLRTNTPIPDALFLSGALLLLVRGLKRDHVLSLIGCGVLAGLAYLTRSEVMLFVPVLFATLVLYKLVDPRLSSRRLALYGGIVLITMLIVIAPWLVRNLHETGSLTTPHLSRLFFMADVRDPFAYGRDFNWSTLRASQSIGQIVGKRLFEMAASVKMMLLALDVVLPVAVLGGLALLGRKRLITLAPALMMVAVFYLFYTLLIPYYSQAGSLKKAYLSVVPLLMPVGAYAFERAITDPRIRQGAVVLTLGLMTANAVEMMRTDINATNTFVGEMEKVVGVLKTLPDTNDDGEIILMTQDQFMLRFLGYRSVMIPMEDRDTVLEVARRYGVDYLMMPAGRPSLDPIYDGKETDPRFVLVQDVPGTNVKLYRLDESAP